MFRFRWAAVAALFFALALLTAGGAHATPNHPTLVVTSTHVGDTLTISGCGYRYPSYEVYLYVYAPDGSTLVAGATIIHPDTCFSMATGITLDQPGVYESYSFQNKGTTGVGSYQFNHPTVDYDFAIS
jgi:hypothetical protein